MLNPHILPRIMALADEQGGLPSFLTSGTAIVVYIFLILTVIAVLVITVLVGGRDKEEPPAPADPLATTPMEEQPQPHPETRFCMLSRIEGNRHRYGH